MASMISPGVAAMVMLDRVCSVIEPDFRCWAVRWMSQGVESPEVGSLVLTRPDGGARGGQRGAATRRPSARFTRPGVERFFVSVRVS